MSALLSKKGGDWNVCGQGFGLSDPNEEQNEQNLVSEGMDVNP